MGSLSNILVRVFDVRAGNAVMYFPEANVLAPTTTDPASKTPAFKCVVVTVAAEGAAAEQTGRRALELVRG